MERHPGGESTHDAFEEIYAEVLRQERMSKLEAKIEAEIKRDDRLRKRPGSGDVRPAPVQRRHRIPPRQPDGQT